MKPLPLLISVLIVALNCGAQPVTNASVDLAWDTYTNQPGITGFKLYYGHETGLYTNSIFVPGGNSTNATIPGLDLDTTYYIAATAIGTNGLESEFSNEVVFRTSGSGWSLRIMGMTVHQDDPEEPPPPPDLSCNFQRHQNTNAPNGYSLLTHNRWMATCFMSSSGYSPCGGEVSLVRIGDMQGTLRFSIYQGFLPQTQADPAWSVAVNVGDLPAMLTNNFPFAWADTNQPAVVAGTTNWLVIQPEYTFSGTGSYLRWLRNGNPSVIGSTNAMSIYRSYDQGATWILDAQRRGLFRLRSTPPPSQ